MTRAVEDVLEEIDAGSSPRMLVLNKADVLDDERRRELSFRHPDAVLVSAADRRGPRGAAASASPPSSRRRSGRRAARARSPRARCCREMHEVAGEMEREDTPEGVRLTARLPTVVAERYGRYAVNGRPRASGLRSRSRPCRGRRRRPAARRRRPARGGQERHQQQLRDPVARLGA